MKKCLPLILFAFGVLSGLNASASDPNSKNDPWLQRHLAKEKLIFSSTVNNKNGEPIKFFNGFSIGASGGLALFHGSLADYDSFAPLSDFDTYYKFGWRIYAEREIWSGIAAKLQFESGKLEGGRLPGAQSLPVDFKTEFSTLSAAASFDILNELFNKNGKKLNKYKFYFNAEVGVGITWFRSLSYWRAEDGRIRDYVGYTVTDENPPTQRFTAEKKDKPEIVLNIPVGFTAGYRINYKTDVTFSYTLNNTMTNKLDTWDRDYAADDKYSYFGVGLRYNFNREKEDYPRKKKKEKKEKTDDEKDKKWSLFGSKKEDVEPNEVDLEQPVQARQGNPVDPSQQDKDLEEVRMKMFELQLKLFEMQYLLNGGKNPNTGTTPTAKPAGK